MFDPKLYNAELVKPFESSVTPPNIFLLKTYEEFRRCVISTLVGRLVQVRFKRG